jgi:hypothetical protein
MGAGLTQHSAPLGIRQHRRPTVASLGIARSPRAGGPRPKVKIGGSWGMGAASRQYSHLQLCGWFLTLPHAPLPRRCVFDPWVLGASVGSKLCGESRFERPLHFI